MENKNVTKFAFNLNSPISTLDSNKQCNLLAVGGRDILKIVDINFKDEKFYLRRNLRLSKLDLPKQNTNYLEWNPNDDNKISTAALGGSISIWDVNQGTGAKLNTIFKGHTQAINKLNWHPTQADTIISASHDGSVKLWDLKTQQASFEIKLGDSVRDIKFVPSNPNYFVAALENGSLEQYDTRNPSKAFFSNSMAHKQAILTLDFNPQIKNYLATGSMDKVVKIWDINNLEKEKLKIQYHHGVGFVKWRKENDICISSCAASFHKDSTITLWDVRKPKYPEAVQRGHKDVVTACVFDPNSEYIVTCSRDGYLICHRWDDAYKPMKFCNKYAMSFDLDSTLAFTFRNTKETGKNNVYLRSKLNLFSNSSFDTQREEIKHYAEKYKIPTGDESLIEACEFNAEVAKDNQNVATLWRDIPAILKEMSSERTENNSVNFAKFLKLSSRTVQDDSLNSPDIIAHKNNKSFLGPNDINLLLTFYEKHPDKFKADVNEKKIVIKEGRILIQPQFIKDILSMIQDANKELERTGSKADSKRMEKLTCDSVVRTVQELINAGDLQSAYHMYLILNEKISFPESSVKLWALGYIELLRTYRFYLESNVIIRSCPLSIINEGNKKSTTFYPRCGICRKISELDGNHICTNCKKFLSICSICKLPVKGLMLWCQVCGHGGHYREIYDWFSGHDECPTGCHHKCFTIRRKAVKEIMPAFKTN